MLITIATQLAVITSPCSTGYMLNYIPSILYTVKTVLNSQTKEVQEVAA